MSRTIFHQGPSQKKDIEDSSHVCSNVAWAYAVNLDVVLTPFIAEGFGQLPERPFCRGVRRDRETTLKRHKGAKINYFPPA